MKLIDCTIEEVTPDLNILNYGTDVSKTVRKESIVFFDIETTGFSPLQTSLYLIGCVYNENSTWKMRQWFLESHNEEPDALRDFSVFLSNFDTIVHFNGTTFDIPYMNKKYIRYKQPSPFARLNSIDIYKTILPYKKLFNSDSLKQKSCEHFLGIYREDTFSGKDLISLYNEYTKSHDERLLKVLLLHNKEDLTGMLSILPMLLYQKLFTVIPEFVCAKINACATPFNAQASLKSSLTLEFKYPFSIQKNVNYNDTFGCMLSFEGCRLNVTVPVYEGELKFFYENYRDYYYLPFEDCAIHKSVAMFVDKEFRQKATAKNCYTKKQGRFIPISPSSATELKTLQAANMPLFKETFLSDTSFLEIQNMDYKAESEFYGMYLQIILNGM